MTGLLQTIAHRANRVGIALVVLAFSGFAAAAESPAELISSYRLKHGEVKVVRDATLDRIAMDQARAMAA
ncbi:MAG: CAP domain-containing protein, partial [Bradyrhizobium sp.]